MQEQTWITKAKSYIGLKEIKGDVAAPEIVQFWKDIKNSGLKDDETPWCAGFVGACLEQVGIKSTRSAASQSYLNWGEVLSKPIMGCIVVFKRDGGGHVGFVMGKDQNGNIMVLGGNQSDAVNIKPFKTERIVGYRWPIGVKHPIETTLKIASSDGKLSTNEA